jgi:hypothetical protein
LLFQIILIDNFKTFSCFGLVVCVNVDKTNKKKKHENRFSAMKPCGCILSARALREVASSEKLEAQREAAKKRTNSSNSSSNSGSSANASTTSTTTTTTTNSDSSTELTCAHCGTALTDSSDVVTLNMPPEEYAAAQSALLQQHEIERLEVG